MKAWQPKWISATLALLCGLALRVVLVHNYALVQGDSLLYGRIAANLLQHGVYGYADPLRPTLIRLPGYPLFLAGCFKLFGVENYLAVLRVQIAVDLLTCLLCWRFARDFASARTANFALWLACLCPFTATYCAAPLTETLSIFCVALAVLAAARCVAAEFRSWPWLLVLSFALSYSILLRPDGGLLAAAVIGYLLLHSLLQTDCSPPHGHGASSAGWGWPQRRTVARLALVSLLTLLPLAPWTLRNWRVFHVVQPLAPRYANDPGELDEAGYKSWTKTWFADAASNEEFYWCADDCPLRADLLPARAFDSPEQRAHTARLLDDTNGNANSGPAITAAIDARFALLARERNAAHPLRSLLGLPLLRVADMLLRPRTELFPVPARWWQMRKHPWPSLVAIALALLNAAYLLAAAVAFVRRRVPMAGMLLAYVALRCCLLLTIENAEPRYTLEFFPIVFCAAAFALQRTQAGSSTASR